MRSANKLMRRFLMGALTCLLLATLSTPALSQFTSKVPTQQSQTVTDSMSVGKMLDISLESAKSTLVAQGMTESKMKSYVAVLSKQNVVPTSPMTNAQGAVGGVLVGDRFVVRGNFSSLSSAMRDYGTDPITPPNPNITSAFHIHQGEPTENGPFQYALNVTTDETGRKGSAMGEYALTAEQVQALSEGKLYVDLHTTMNRAGELRGILMPY
ncbi:MAG: CHRD domain-containing protein [Timaviella obliquedivisa GSE-PSE-MK23-08B]|nr:CHRD domain-containing protein [Timaviella obliquedivisa GSE-PSE-MK23-08B]